MTDTRAPVTLRSLGVSVYLPSLLFFVGDGAVVPIIAIAARDLGASAAMAGLIVALRGVGVLLFDVPSGWIGARVGERAMVLAASCAIIGALVGWMLTTSVVVFAILALVQGCGWSTWQLARMSYIGAVVPMELRGRALSTLGGTTRIGMFAGPFLGAAAAAIAGLDAVFVVAAAMSTLAAVVLARVVPRDEGRAVADDDSPGVVGMLREHAGALMTAGVAATSIQALRQARNALVPLWADHLGLSPETASLVFGLSLATEVLLFYPGGTVLDRHGRKAVAVPCLAIMGVGLALLPLSSGVMSLALVAALLGIGNGLSSGVVNTLGIDLAPARGRTTFLGIWRVFGDMGAAGGPLMVAATTAAVTLGGAAVAVGVGGLAAAAFVTRFLPETRG